MGIPFENLSKKAKEILRQQENKNTIDWLKDAFPVKKKNKFNAKKTIVHGIKFASQHEACQYLILVDMMKQGEILWFARQARFLLPGGIEYFADFIVVYENHTEVWDAKGVKTDVYINKKKQMMSEYGIGIEEV
jgi:hypothetical protein